MGFISEFNWVLKLKKEQGFPEEFEVGDMFDFFKSGNRLFPVGSPIDLINDRWEAIAKVAVTEYKQDGVNTIGKYKILKIFSGFEKEMVTYYWRESIEMLFGKKITDWSNIKVT